MASKIDLVEATHEDLEILVQGMDEAVEPSIQRPMIFETEVSQEATDAFKKWYNEDQEDLWVKWFELRLKTDITIQCTKGIWLRGAVDILTAHEDFDEHGGHEVA
ncbi:hypothetical protein K469DRAFT_751965 [Zopfia rhizophila CBS 207.26]|uniref:Uncharacterized protein n=1 Tax=Zopfia rhizophila CBS 207.26 TaxID=1314779 RepID=A0A6A6DTA4_9PEZI|nr:hypothetical protein K469DRAFT_751965 [Zopfia rhizophila CBS 207.26]